MKKIIAVLVIVGLAVWGYLSFKSREAKPTAEAAETTKVKLVRGSIYQAVSSTGRVVSNLDVDIKCKASGEIVTLPFDISQMVKKGDLLLEIDPVNQVRAVHLAEVELSASKAKERQAEQNLAIAEQNLVTSRERAQSTLKSAQIRAKNTRDKADRREELLKQGLGSQEDYAAVEMEAAQADLDLASADILTEELKVLELGLEVKRQDVTLAKATVESDQISLSNAQQQLIDTKVIAPMDGVVAASSVQKGMIIASAITNVGGGSTVLTLADLSRVFVLASVDESDIGKVALGQTVNVTADSYPGVVMKGTVVRIATRGVNVSNVVTFEVKIEVLGEEKKLLKPEMIASVQIVSAEKQDVVLLPAQAMTRQGSGLVATVVGAGDVNEERPIEVGITDGDRWEVVSGLRDGETVLVRKDEALSKWRAEQAKANPQRGMFGRPEPKKKTGS